MLLEGLFVPLTTTFYGDGRLYLRKLEHNVERYSRTPAAGLALLTPTGEGDLLSDAERLEVLRVAVAVAAPEKVLLADCTRPSVMNTLELLAAAKEFGFDAALLRPPALLAGEDRDSSRRTYLQAVADRSPLPLVLADDAMADLSGRALVPDLIASLARSERVLGWVAGTSDAGVIADVLERTSTIEREVVVTPVFAAVTGRMLARTPPAAAGTYVDAATLGSGATALATAPPPATIRTRSRRVGFQVLAGRTRTILDALRAGARGAVLPFACCAPQACYEALAAWKDADEPLAAEKAGRLRAASERMEEQIGVPAIKAGADRNGYFGGRGRLPLLPLRGTEEAEVEALLRAMRS